MTRVLRLVTLALLLMMAVTTWAQPPRGKVLAFFTTGGETDHYLFAQDAMRRLGTNAATRGYSFAATSDWDALSDAGLKDVGLVIWLNDQPHTAAQRDAFRRYMDGGGAWLGFHISGFSSNAWPWYRNDFLGGGGFVASNWPSLPGRVNVDDPGHPTVKNMPASFVAPRATMRSRKFSETARTRTRTSRGESSLLARSTSWRESNPSRGDSS